MKQIFISLETDELLQLIKDAVREEIDKFQIQQDISEDLIKAAEVCDFLKISKPTLYKWLNQGKIIGYYLGSRLFFKKSEIENALQVRKR